MDNWACTGKLVKGKTIKTGKNLLIYSFTVIEKNLTNRFALSWVDEKRAETATLDIFTLLQLTIRSHPEMWNKETSQLWRRFFPVCPMSNKCFTEFNNFCHSLLFSI
jgi:hypothetical protein